MKTLSLITTLAALATLTVGTAAGVGAAPAKGKPAAKKPAKAVCTVCKVREGAKAKPEEVKATLKYKGKTYPFCDVSEKAEFISNPAKYTK